MSDTESEDYSDTESDTESEIIENDDIQSVESEINSINNIDDLREEILKYIEDPKTKDYAKLYEIYKFTPLYDKEYYDSKVLLEIDFDNFSIYLEEVKTKEQDDLWMFFKISTTSVHTNSSPGKKVRFLVKENISGKYIGILALGDDRYQCVNRDRTIGWDNTNHHAKIYNVINIRGCVGLQPLAFNYNIGKLLCSLCFSKEVYEVFLNKYNIKIAAITTMGINGRAPQYECLKCIRHIGYTKGMGVNHLSEKLFEKASEILIDNGFTLIGDKLRKWRYILKVLEIDKNVIYHGTKRAVYMGYTSKDAKDFLTGKNYSFEVNLDSVDVITKKWISRWGKRRIDNVIKSNRFKDNKSPEWTYDIFNVEIPEYVKNTDNQFITRNTREFNEEIYNNLPKLSDSYIAGLFDGDGTILYTKQSLIPRIEISQCDPYAIFALYKQFGGSIISVIPKNKNARPQYKYHISKSEKLINCLRNNCIIKEQRADNVYKLFNSLNKKDKDYNIELLRGLFLSYEKTRKIYTPTSLSMYSERINEEYIAGLFDAEGCIRIIKRNNSLSVGCTITQRSNPEILSKIREFYIDKYDLKFSITTQRLILYSYDNINQFICSIDKYIIIKKEQIECFKDVYKFRKNKTKYDMDLYNEKMMTLKQQLYNINISLEEKQKERENERDLKEIYESGIIIKRVRNRKKKDYDRISHIVNITIATMNSKRVISDDIIFEVKRKLENGMKQSKIIEEMQLSRHTVNKIARGILLPLSASKEECKEKVCKKIERKSVRDKLSDSDKKKFDGETTAISKRAYNKDKCLEILNYTYENRNKVTQTMIGERYALSFTQINNLLNGKTLLYKREFENEAEYEDYLELVQKVKSIDYKDISRLMTKIKVRKIASDVIVNVMLFSRNNPRMSRKDIGKEFKLTEDQVRGIVTGKTAVYECEFPINGITWEQYNA